MIKRNPIIESIGKIIFFLIPLVLILATLYPSLNLPLNDDTHEHLSIIHGNGFFGKDLSFLHPPLNFYFKHYGIQFASLVVAFKLFYLNSKMYFILVLVLKSLAAFSIYYFVLKWTKSVLAGIISALFFAVSTATLQNITRVTLFQIYIAIISLCLFLDRWFTFHYRPNRTNLILSIIFFMITILSHPIRMTGIVFLAIGGEAYWLFKQGFGKSIKIKFIHLLLIIFSIYLLIFVIGSISSTEELSSKLLSPKIISLSLMTGSPPILASLLLFIANLIVSPFTFTAGYLNLSVAKNIVTFLPLLSLIFLIVCLKKRRFILALIAITAIVFPNMINFSTPYLIDWQPEWIVVTQLGGVIFIFLNLLIFLLRDRNESLAQIGLLGSALVLSNLLLPWMVTPQVSFFDQSPFLFIHRYYTIPSIGLAMLIASVFVLSLQSIKPLFNLNIFRLLIPITIALLIYLQIMTSHWYLIRESKGIDAAKIDLLWAKLKPYSKDLAQIQNSYVYMEIDSSIDKEYIQKIFPRKVEIELSQTITPNINFIFSRNKVLQLRRDKNKDLLNNFYAFRFDGENLYDIKDEFNNVLP